MPVISTTTEERVRTQAIKSVVLLYEGRLIAASKANKKRPQYLVPKITKLTSIRAEIITAVTTGWVSVNDFPGEHGYWITNTVVDIFYGARKIASVGMHTTSGHNNRAVCHSCRVDWINFRVNPNRDNSPWALICFDGNYNW